MPADLFSSVCLCRTRARLEETLAELPGATGWAISRTESQPFEIPTNTEALIITSRSAVDVLPVLDVRVSALPVISVGPQTTRDLETAGFRVVHTGDSGAAGLVPELNRLPYRHYVHVHGDRADLFWHKNIAAHVEAVCGYRTVFTEEIPENINSLDVFAFFSVEGVRHAVGRLSHANMDSRPRSAVCLSGAVETALKSAPDHPFTETRVVDRPDAAHMLEALKNRIRKRSA